MTKVIINEVGKQNTDWIRGDSCRSGYYYRDIDGELYLGTTEGPVHAKSGDEEDYDGEYREVANVLITATGWTSK